MRELGKTVQNNLVQEEKDPTFQFATCLHYLLPKKRFVILGWQNHGYGISLNASLRIPDFLLTKVTRFNTFVFDNGLEKRTFNSETTTNSLSLEYGLIYLIDKRK